MLGRPPFPHTSRRRERIFKHSTMTSGLWVSTQNEYTPFDRFLSAMSYDFRTISRTILILAVTALMVPAGLSGVQVHAANCATGLSPNLHLTLLVPTSNPARRAWAVIIQRGLQCLGIDAARVELPFSPKIFDRALSPTDPNVLGKPFDQGGFDILFVGYNLGVDPDPYSLYHSIHFAPSGSNYYLWNNTQNDNLDNLIKTTLNATTRNDYVKQC